MYHPLSATISDVVASDHDSLVREYCKNAVSLYLSEADDADEHTAVREATLTFLADQSRYLDSDRYVSSAEIISHLAEMGFGEVSAYALRSQIIAHFRDSGVIIASNSAGYKIPTEVKDISNYVARCDAVVGPILGRLKHAREQIQLTSHNELDILAAPSFEGLKSLLDRL